MVRDARRRAPHHEGLRPHPRVTASPLSLEEQPLGRVSKDEATELENTLRIPLAQSHCSNLDALHFSACARASAICCGVNSFEIEASSFLASVLPCSAATSYHI